MRICVAVLLCIEAGGDDGHADFVTERVVDDGTEDDVRVLVGVIGDEGGSLVDLVEAEVRATGDREQDALGAVHGGLEQRRVDGLLGRDEGSVLAAGVADAHESRTGVGHDGADVGKVDVDHARGGDQVRNALNTVVEHLVGEAEGLDDGQLFLGELEQAVVRNNDKRVADLGEGGDALLGLAGAARALELERLGDNADGQRSLLLRRAGTPRARSWNPRQPGGRPPG